MAQHSILHSIDLCNIPVKQPKKSFANHFHTCVFYYIRDSVIMPCEVKKKSFTRCFHVFFTYFSLLFVEYARTQMLLTKNYNCSLMVNTVYTNLSLSSKKIYWDHCCPFAVGKLNKVVYTGYI